LIKQKVQKELALKQGIQPVSCHALCPQPFDYLGSGHFAFGPCWRFSGGG